MNRVGFFEGLIFYMIAFTVWVEVLHYEWWILLIIFFVAFFLDAMLQSFRDA